MTRATIAPAVGFTLLLSACATELDALPNDARAANTGRFPTFREEPRAANVQLTDREVALEIAGLRAAARRAAEEAGMPMTDLFRLAMIGDRAAMEALGMSDFARLDEIVRLAEAGNEAATRALGGPDEVAELRRLRDTAEARTLERIRGGGSAAEPDRPPAANPTER